MSFVDRNAQPTSTTEGPLKKANAPFLEVKVAGQYAEMDEAEKTSRDAAQGKLKLSLFNVLMMTPQAASMMLIYPRPIYIMFRR